MVLVDFYSAQETMLVLMYVLNDEKKRCSFYFLGEGLFTHSDKRVPPCSLNQKLLLYSTQVYTYNLLNVWSQQLPCLNNWKRVQCQASKGIKMLYLLIKHLSFIKIQVFWQWQRSLINSTFLLRHPLHNLLSQNCRHASKKPVIPNSYFESLAIRRECPEITASNGL